jgi:ATPase subunit of ABC transporter with duplicated ATPase domains
LDLEKSTVETIIEIYPFWTHAEIREHLTDFLFKKNEEVNMLVKNLSGRERALRSLAKIATHPPKLLILDEITDNIDMETRNHVIEISPEYPGAMIFISHDNDFLNEIRIKKYYEISETHLPN